MNNSKEKVKLDEVLKFLFSTSNKVIIKLLNSVFNENFSEDEVDLTISNNEFVEDTLEIIRGDMFLDILNKHHSKKHSYHIEFQTKNDSSMVIRMFEYGFRKSIEQSRKDDSIDIKTIYFPKQKVIFFEENKNIKDTLDLKIVLPNNSEFIYSVDVMKYWQYDDKKLLENKMYPLIPLQLFLLRKDLIAASKNNNIEKLKELSYKARNLAKLLAYESRDLLNSKEILDEDFHKMLLAIQNLIEYLNRNYINDEYLEDEVIKLTKSLYDPEIEKKGIEKGIEKGIKEGIEKGERKKAIEIAKSLLDVLDTKTIAIKTGLTIEEVESLKN